MISKVRTGDVLLFSSNTPTSFLTKTMISTEWNHVGVAIRMKNNSISLNEEGELFIFETNTNERYDPVLEKMTFGAGFSRINEVFIRYNKVVCRPLKDFLRKKPLDENIANFIFEFHGNTFPSHSLPFISVWLGLPLSQKYDKEMFCSELLAHFYRKCVVSTNENSLNKLKEVFGDITLFSEDLVSPKHYSKFITPHSPIFKNEEFIIYEQRCDLIYSIYQPFLIVLVICIVIIMIVNHDDVTPNTFPKKTS